MKKASGGTVKEETRLISMMNAPLSLASDAKEAAGWTIPDVPMTSITSASRQADRLFSRSLEDRFSPNQTT